MTIIWKSRNLLYHHRRSSRGSTERLLLATNFVSEDQLVSFSSTDQLVSSSSTDQLVLFNFRFRPPRSAALIEMKKGKWRSFSERLHPVAGHGKVCPKSFCSNEKWVRVRSNEKWVIVCSKSFRSNEKWDRVCSTSFCRKKNMSLSLFERKMT
jgi:hypothetical protein